MSVRRRIFLALGQPNFLRWLQWPAIRQMLACEYGQSVLDLGCGSAYYASLIARRPAVAVYGADVSFGTDVKEFAARHAVSLIRVDGQRLPFRDGVFDRVLMSSLLHMVPDPKTLLREARRVLSKDGLLILSVPNDYQFIPRILSSKFAPLVTRSLGIPSDYQDLKLHLNRRFHVNGPKGYYSRSDLERLIESAGFEIKQHRYVPGHLASLVWELSILLFARVGNLAFHLSLLFYPLARLMEWISIDRPGSEHLLLMQRH